MPVLIPAPEFRLARPVPRIHPFQVTMLISLAALAAIAWASDEWDWGRLVDDEGPESRVEVECPETRVKRLEVGEKKTPYCEEGTELQI